MFKKSISLFFIGLAICFIILTTYHSLLFPYPTPWWDHWDYLKQYLAAKSYLEFLWGTTTEHRLVGTRLLLLFDLWWAKGDGYLVRIFSYVALTFMLWTLFCATRHFDSRRSVNALFAVSFASFPLFFLAQWEAFYLNTLGQVYFVNLFSLVCLYLTARSVESEGMKVRPSLYFSAHAAGIFSALNFSTGIICLPIASLIIAARRGLGRPFWGSIALLSLTLITYYYNPKIGGGKGGNLWLPRLFENIDTDHLLLSYFAIFKYICKFTGLLFGGAGGLEFVNWQTAIVSRTGFTFTLGSFTFAVLFVSVIALLRNAKAKGSITPGDAFWLSLFAFCGLSLLSVMFGRAGSGNVGHAMASRYRVYSLFLVAALLVFWVPRLQQMLMRRPELKAAVYPLTAVFIAYFVVCQVMYVKYPAWRTPYLNEGALSLMVGTPDHHALARSFPAKGIPAIVRIAAWLKSQRLHMFAGRPYDLLGKQLRNVFFVTGGTCGRVDRYDPLPAGVPGVRIFGAARMLDVQSRRVSIVVTNAEDRIVGLGYSGYPKQFDKAVASPAFPRDDENVTAWAAYAPLAGKSALDVKIYLVEERLKKVETACYVGKVFKE